MKIIVRSFAVVLLLAGVVAAGHSQHNAQAAGRHQMAVSHQPVNSAMPAPACPPDDPDGCGIGPNPKLQ